MPIAPAVPPLLVFSPTTAEMAVEQLIERAGNVGNMVIKEFDSVDEAMIWLSQPLDGQK